MFNTSIRNILDLHVKDREYANNLNKLVKNLFDLLKDEFNLDESHRTNLAIVQNYTHQVEVSINTLKIDIVTT